MLHPHKQRDFSSPPSSPSCYSPYTTHQPSLAALAHDRLASRAKLQSTWEDIIQKYSSIPDSEADEIDLETEEVIIDRGHLRSMHDSILWDPLDSERDDESDHETEYLEVEEEHLPQEEKKLPCEEDVLKFFGEEDGRSILEYLQQRTNVRTQNSENRGLWAAMADEEAIFNRAKELWREYRMRKPSLQKKERRFDKESFDRAVFGATVAARTAFEEAVFGQSMKSDMDDWTDYDNDEDEESINNIRRLARKGAGNENWRSPTLSARHTKRERDDSQFSTPRKRLHTPSCKSLIESSPAGLSAKAREKLRGNVISGLIIDASDDDEVDILTSPSVKATRKSSLKEIPETPSLTKKQRSVSSPSKLKGSQTSSLADDAGVIIMNGLDTQEKCGQVGYRCTKAFCFKCIA